MAANRLLAVVESFLNASDFNFERIEGKTMLKLGIRAKSGGFTCIAQTREEQEQFIFYSSAPVNVPGDKFVLASEFLTRANWAMILGNFEMDYSDGEVRFKTSIDVEGGKLTETMVRNLVASNILMMDKYLPGLNKVIYGGISPEDAIKEIEG